MTGAGLVAAVTGGALPREARVTAGDLRLHYLEWGEATAPPVLLVHGNGGHAHWWDPLVPFRAPAGDSWRPICAVTARAPGPPRRRTRSPILPTICALSPMQLAPGRIAIIAHSMGARIAAWFAARSPSRPRARAGAARHQPRRRRCRDGAALARARRRPTRRPRSPSYDEAARGVSLRAARAPRPPPIDADLAHHAVVERRAGRVDVPLRPRRAVARRRWRRRHRPASPPAVRVRCGSAAARGVSSRRGTDFDTLQHAGPTSKGTILPADIIFSCRTRRRQESRCGGSSIIVAAAPVAAGDVEHRRGRGRGIQLPCPTRPGGALHRPRPRVPRLQLSAAAWSRSRRRRS